ncbi:MAG: hypothetical protein J6X48_00755 [Lachnospiraceae bacterium]|nr:hypothetical protein [Lachnospiraceae bacterium]
MGLKERPSVHEIAGGKYWENQYKTFYAKVFVPDNDLEGQVNNYGFRAPLLLIFEEHKMDIEEALKFATLRGFTRIAAKYDAPVVFVYPTCEDGWAYADESLYQELISEVSLYPDYEDGVVAWDNFFSKRFEGYFIRGAKHRAYLYGFGRSADYIATKLLKTIHGEYLWGPGEITPAVCSLERLTTLPTPERKDIAIISVLNECVINMPLEKSEHFYRSQGLYEEDCDIFAKKFKRWCGNLEIEPTAEDLNMVEETGIVEVKTSPDNQSKYKDLPTHKAGYFAFYNKGAFDNGPIPLVLAFHGGGDTALHITYVPGWIDICHRDGFLLVAIDDHLSLRATEIMEILEDIKKRYNVDEKRIYATGFSMGSGKTFDLFMEYPDAFAGFMPCSALFPIRNNPWGLSLGDPRVNTSVSKPIFYSGGEDSTLPELPFQDEESLVRIKHVAKINKLKKKFDFDFNDKSAWKDPVYGEEPDEIKVLHDTDRNSDLTVRYYESEDGVIRTAFASVSNQIHECRHHSIEAAWEFISQFKNE